MIVLPSEKEIAVRTMLEWTFPDGFSRRLEHTHTSVVALKIANCLMPEICTAVTKYVLNCRQPDGGFNDGTWPESETECAYSGLRALKLCGTLDQLPPHDQSKAVRWIRSKQNPDGGFGGIIDWGYFYKTNEKSKDLKKAPFRQDSSAHACFFAYGALEAMDATSQVDLTKLVGFIVSSQNPDGSWGFYPDNPHGNTITTAMALTVLARVGKIDLIDRPRTVRWLLSCQRPDGSFAEEDREPLYGSLHTARASKALRLLDGFHNMNVAAFENYWNKLPLGTGGWSIVSRAMAMGLPLALQER
jgi:prenyltransferase beta subunit